MLNFNPLNFEPKDFSSLTLELLTPDQLRSLKAALSILDGRIDHRLDEIKFQVHMARVANRNVVLALRDGNHSKADFYRRKMRSRMCAARAVSDGLQPIESGLF